MRTKEWAPQSKFPIAACTLADISPGPMHVSPSPKAKMSPRSPLSHRGFNLNICRSMGLDGDGVFAYTVAHHDLALHRSRADFRSAGAADRAARRFIDDALGAFDHAATSLAA